MIHSWHVCDDGTIHAYDADRRRIIIPPDQALQMLAESLHKHTRPGHGSDNGR